MYPLPNPTYLTDLQIQSHRTTQIITTARAIHCAEYPSYDVLLSTKISPHPATGVPIKTYRAMLIGWLSREKHDWRIIHVDREGFVSPGMALECLADSVQAEFDWRTGGMGVGGRYGERGSGVGGMEG